MRYQLMPYTYTLCREAYDTGMPLMRALWLHYPGDKESRGQSQQYLWGRDMLVAPVYEQGATSRQVYLPAGTWYDWWDDSRHSGGTTVTRSVDLATMPLYVRAGAIIPFDPVRQYTAEKVAEPTTLRVYPGADGTFTLYDDDGNSQAYLSGSDPSAQWIECAYTHATRTLTIRPDRRMTLPAGFSRTFRIQVIGAPAAAIRQIEFRGAPLDVAL